MLLRAPLHRETESDKDAVIPPKTELEHEPRAWGDIQCLRSGVLLWGNVYMWGVCVYRLIAVYNVCALE